MDARRRGEYWCRMGDADATTGAGPVDLGPLPNQLGYALRRAQMAVFADFHQEFAPLDLRPAQFSVLLVIRHTPGVRPSQAAEALGIKRANFVPLISGLEGRCLLERRPARDDRRARALHLTPGGEALLRRSDAALQRHERRWRDMLGPAAHGALLAVLATVARPA